MPVCAFTYFTVARREKTEGTKMLSEMTFDQVSMDQHKRHTKLNILNILKDVSMALHYYVGDIVLFGISYLKNSE